MRVEHRIVPVKLWKVLTAALLGGFIGSTAAVVAVLWALGAFA